MQGLIEDEPSGEGAENGGGGGIGALRGQVVFAGLHCLAPLRRRISESGVENLIKRTDFGELRPVGYGDEERVAAGEGCGVRCRHPVRPYRPDKELIGSGVARVVWAGARGSGSRCCGYVAGGRRDGEGTQRARRYGGTSHSVHQQRRPGRDRGHHRPRHQSDQYFFLHDVTHFR